MDSENGFQRMDSGFHSLAEFGIPDSNAQYFRFHEQKDLESRLPYMGQNFTCLSVLQLLCVSCFSGVICRGPANPNNPESCHGAG